MELQIDLGCRLRIRWYQDSHPHGTPHWLGLFSRIRWYQNSHPRGTSNWLGVSTRIRWYQNSHPHVACKPLRWAVTCVDNQPPCYYEAYSEGINYFDQPLETGCAWHLLRTVIANSGVECILHAKTLPLHLTGMGLWKDPKRYQGAAIPIASVVAKLKWFDKEKSKWSTCRF